MTLNVCVKVIQGLVGSQKQKLDIKDIYTMTVRCVTTADLWDYIREHFQYDKVLFLCHS